MKKIIITLVTILMINAAFSQAKFGIQLGSNFSNVDWVDDGEKLVTDSKTGLAIGLVADVEIGNSLHFRPELNYVQKGARENDSYTNTFGGSTTYYTTEGKIKLNYLELPLNFCYNVPVGSGELLLGAGPIIGIGIGGAIEYSTTVKTNSMVETEEFSNTVKFDGDKNSTSTDQSLHLKPIDINLGFLGGYRLKNGVVFTAGYNVGLTNIYPDALSSLKNKGFVLKLGYMFNKK